MNRVRLILAVTVVLMLPGCKHSTQDNPWPVWILYVHPKEVIGLTGEQIPVDGCASVIWKYVGDSQTHTENCYQGSNFVKVWNPITGQVNITYYVHCSGYADSQTYSAFFIPPAVQGQGRDGAEVIVDETVILRRQ